MERTDTGVSTRKLKKYKTYSLFGMVGSLVSMLVSFLFLSSSLNEGMPGFALFGLIAVGVFGWLSVEYSRLYTSFKKELEDGQL